MGEQRPEQRPLIDKWIAIILVFFGTVLSGLVALSELDTCRRVVSLSAVISFAIVALIYQVGRMKARNELPESLFRKLPSDIVIRIVTVVFVAILLVCGFWIVFPDRNPIPGCGDSAFQNPPAPIPTLALPLSSARIDFLITFSNGDETRIPTDGVLTLATNDQVVVSVSVNSLNYSPVSWELLYKYYSASGQSSDGDVMTYTAKQADIITVWIKDKVSRDEIFRNIHVVIK